MQDSILLHKNIHINEPPTPRDSRTKILHIFPDSNKFKTLPRRSPQSKASRLKCALCAGWLWLCFCFLFSPPSCCFVFIEWNLFLFFRSRHSVFCVCMQEGERESVCRAGAGWLNQILRQLQKMNEWQIGK